MARSPDGSPLQRILAADVTLSARLTVTGWPRPIALLIAHSGDSPLWLAGAAVALLWGGSPWWSFGWRVVTATVVGGTAATLLKYLFRRQRPAGPSAGLYIHLDRHGFPSGHAVRTACTAVLLAPLVPDWAGGWLAVWTGSVALARVALQVHYLSDVIVGMALGGLIGAVLLAVF